MAIVESDSIVGEWEFHETPNFEETDGEVFCDGVFYVRGNIYNQLYLYKDTDDWAYMGANYLTYEETIYSVGTYDTDADGWTGSDAQYLKIFSVSSANEQFVQNLKSNAERLSGGYSLYTRENGEWVYKCEIV